MEANLQGRKAKALYPYKAALNDELTFKFDDLITLIQASEDGTWYEGTLNNRTGWFPSNYVQLLEETINADEIAEDLRIEAINELKSIEETFIDEINSFIKTILIPLEISAEAIIPLATLKQIQSVTDELIHMHSNLDNGLKEITDAKNAKIGGMFLCLGPKFKTYYESYSKLNPKFVNTVNRHKDALNKFFESSRHLNQTAVLYTTKCLASPFKQLEIYIKLLKEIKRHTEDFHSDRGDIQRAVEFYEDLLFCALEIRKKKEYEIDIMCSNINNLEEDIFRNGESLFLSSVFIIYENAEKKDRILILFPYYLIILSNYFNSNRNTNELNFEMKINLVNTGVQVRRIEGAYDDCKYSFEITGPSISRLVIVCSTLYDLKTWIEMLNNIISKSSNNTKNQNQQTIRAKSTGSDKGLKPTSPQPMSPGSNTLKSQQFTSNSQLQQRKIFCIRPHPPLIPHFQPLHDTTNTDPSSTLKRLMHKKPQVSDSSGKYYGADDDMKLLTLLESYWRSKVRHSVNIQSQEAVASTVSKAHILPTPQRGEHEHVAKTNKTVEDKIKHLEQMLQNSQNDTTELKKYIKELKHTTNSLNKQLEHERSMRRKLEHYIKKTNKNVDLSSIVNLEHESSI